MNITYAVQGLRNGAWVTLFAPIETASAARTMIAKLAKDNPACKYRIRWSGIGEPIQSVNNEIQS